MLYTTELYGMHWIHSNQQIIFNINLVTANWNNFTASFWHWVSSTGKMSFWYWNGPLLEHCPSISRHGDGMEMETFSVLLALCERNPFPTQSPVTRSCDIFFDLRLNKRLSKQSRLRRFETPSRSLWYHYDLPDGDVRITAYCLLSKF